MRPITLLAALMLLLASCEKETEPIIVESNEVSLKISYPYQNEKFEQGLAISVDGILKSNAPISGYEVIFIHDGTRDTLDYYYEEGNFNYYTVHHHWVNKLSAEAKVNIVVNAVDHGEILATAGLSVFCKD